MTQAKPKPKPQILQQSLALDSYLRTLLDEMPEDDNQEEISQQPEKQESVEPQKNLVPVQKKPVAEVKPSTALVQSENAAKLQALSVMPDWARQEFPALFFKVDKLILATPLVELARTIRLEHKPTNIPGQPSWFLGLLDVNDYRIGVLDTGQLVFGRTRGSQRDLIATPFRHILITQDKRWGLACDEILSIGKLTPEKVRWRTQRQRKPWLIGTVIEELTAIIDVKHLVPHRKQDYQ